jgi:hypothetical protein
VGSNVMGIEGVSWMRLARSRVQCLVAVNTVMKVLLFFSSGREFNDRMHNCSIFVEYFAACH